MAKVLGGVMVAAMVAALFVAGALVAGDRPVRPQGLMPEVVVTAETPRLVMPTVEVRPGQAVAMMSGSDLRVF